MIEVKIEEVKQMIEGNEIWGIWSNTEKKAERSHKILTLDFSNGGRRARTFTNRNATGTTGEITKGWEIDEDGNLVREIGDKLETLRWLKDGDGMKIER